MEKKPLISVIIACYNAENYLSECLDSLINQTYTNIEIIVCDDCSTDNSTKILDKYCLKDNRIIKIVNSQNYYQAYSRNRCISISKGDYIIIQDADDMSSKNRIEILVEKIRTTPKVDFISSDMLKMDVNGILNGKYETKRVEFPKERDFLTRLPFNHATTIFKRNCLEAVDGYRVSSFTRRGEDYDLFFRLYGNGYKGLNIKDDLYYYRVEFDTYKRRSFSSRVDESIVRFLGYKELKLFPLGLIFILKPYLAHIANIFKLNKFKKVT